MFKRSLSLALWVSLQTMLLAPVLADPVASASEADKALKELSALQSRIDVLKQGGTGVGPFQRIYDQIDGLSKAGKSEEAAKLMSDLGNKLTTQENLRDQAKQLSSTRKIKVQTVTGSATPATNAADPGTKSAASAATAGTQAASSVGAASGNKSIKDKINCLRMQLQQMQANFGMPVGGFHARLNQAERLAATSPWTASAEVDKIAADAEKAVQARSK